MLKSNKKEYELKNLKRFSRDISKDSEEVPSELEEADNDKPGRVKACVEG